MWGKNLAMSKKFIASLITRKWHSKNKCCGKKIKKYIFSTITEPSAESRLCLCSLKYVNLTSAQIEAGRRLIRKKIKKTGKLFVRVSAYLGRTSKPAGVRMGKGKGNKGRDVVAFIKPGSVLYELHNFNVNLGFNALKTISYKLGFKTRILII